MRTRWLLAMVAVVALFAASCGDSDGDDGASETSAVAVEDDSGGDEGEDTTETTAAPPEGTSAPKDDIEISGGDPNSEWCKLAADVQGQLDGIENDPFGFFTPDGITRLTTALDRAVQVAPPEIRSDVAASRDAIVGLASVLEEYDFDLLNIPPADLEAAFDQEALESAGDRITAYNEQVCGISPGDVEATPAAPSIGDSEAAVEAFVNGLTATLPITEEQARCLAEELDFEQLVADGELDPNDPALLDQVFAVLSVCDISIADLTG